MRYEGGQYYVKSPEEMEALFPYAKEALEKHLENCPALPCGDRVRRDQAAEI